MTARPRSTIAAYAIALLALAVLIARAWRIDYDYSIDFQTYWLAGSRVLHGHSTDLYAPGGGPADGTPIPMGAREFKNIPLVAAAFAPLARWDYATAKRIVWWGGLAAVVGAAWCLGRWVLPESLGVPGARAAIAFAAIAAMSPTHVALRHGQTTPFVALALAIALAAAVRGRWILSGIAAGLASVVKFPPLVLGGAQSLIGRWRLVAAGSATLAAAILLSIIAFGPALHRPYVEELRAQAGSVIAAHNNQSIAAFVARLAGGARNQDWTPRPMTPGARAAAATLTLLLAAYAAAELFRRRGAAGTAPAPARLAAEWSAALALGIVVFPVAWDHYELLLAPALVAMGVWIATSHDPKHGRLLAGAGAAYLLLALPTPTAWVETETAGGPLQAIALSHGFLGLTIALVVALRALRQVEG